GLPRRLASAGAVGAGCNSPSPRSPWGPTVTRRVTRWPAFKALHRASLMGVFSPMTMQRTSSGKARSVTTRASILTGGPLAGGALGGALAGLSLAGWSLGGGGRFGACAVSADTNRPVISIRFLAYTPRARGLSFAISAAKRAAETYNS